MSYSFPLPLSISPCCLSFNTCAVGGFFSCQSQLKILSFIYVPCSCGFRLTFAPSPRIALSGKDSHTLHDSQLDGESMEVLPCCRWLVRGTHLPSKQTSRTHPAFPQWRPSLLGRGAQQPFKKVLSCTLFKPRTLLGRIRLGLWATPKLTRLGMVL